MDTVAPAMLGSYQFAEFLAPMATSDFFANVHRKRPMHIAGSADKFAFTMSWEYLNEILDQSSIWTPNTFMLVLDRVTLRPDQFCRDGIGMDGRPTYMVDFEKVRSFVRQGATIVLTDISTLTPGMKVVADALAHDPGGRVQANLYCSWQSHQAFDVHYDVADVFVTQIVGEKVWRVYQQAMRNPVRHPVFTDTARHREMKGPLLAEIIMRPGDVLYIPAGFCHEAMTEHGASVHITYEVRSMNGLDLIPMLYERAVLDEVLRGPLPNATARNGAALDEHLMRFAGRIREVLREPAMRTLLEQKMREFPYPIQNIKLPDDAGKK